MSRRPVTTADRRLSIADGMIAVVAASIGFVLIRQPLPYYGTPSWVFPARRALATATAFLAPSSIALVVIQLRPPRPRFCRLARRPGFAACLAASTAIALVTIPLGLARLRDPLLADASDQFHLTSHGAAFAVLGAWTTLAATGRWRREASSGAERLSWIVGWAWLLILVGSWVIVLAGP